MNIRHSLFIALVALSSTSVAYAAKNGNEAEALAMGHVSAWGSTLDEMTEGLKAASNKAGAKSFKITSAHGGNRYYGTAILYK
ncbi:DUF1471 domain-containing protein [Cedecea neteri]|uniref:DUF1471 domain-containing protein n=1 Tax=Cedecea neteri TaxID=158822 RepID=UPI002AA6D9D0|nr:DUF1471 domain-containing protein [Cedecea neteri]WPU21934.1 DUF1471 domain-containing protein [Cedecea neteri]